MECRTVKNSRKIMSAVYVAVLLVVVSVFGSHGKAMAAETAGNGGLGILEEWEMNPPDYYGGYMPGKDNSVIVFLVENTEERQNEVLAGIPDGIQVTFKPCKYSRKKLLEVYEEITVNRDEYTGLVSWGISVCVFLDGREEPRIKVGVLLDNYPDIVALFEEKYGDIVWLELSNPIWDPDDQEMQQTATSSSVPKGGIADASAQNAYDTEASDSKSSVVKTVKKPSIKKITLKGKKLRIRWKKNSAASKYQVVIRNKKNKKIKDAVTKKGYYTYTIKNNIQSKYTIKVRCYDKKNKCWGKWAKKVVRIGGFSKKIVAIYG